MLNSSSYERVRQPGVGDRGLALQRLGLIGADRVEPLVDLAVDPGDEERRDGVDLAQVVTVGRGLLQTADVGVDHPAVALQGEDQGHVDADPLGDRRGDRRQAGLGGRDLDQHVGPVDDLPQIGRLGDGGLGVHGQTRLDLDRHPAVDAAGGRVGGGEACRRRCGRRRWSAP